MVKYLKHAKINFELQILVHPTIKLIFLRELFLVKDHKILKLMFELN